MRALLLTGFVSVVAQVALLRELSVAFYGLELIYVVALGGWMAWTAAGAALDRGDGRRRRWRRLQRCSPRPGARSWPA